MTGGPEPLSWPVTRHEILSRPLTLCARATKNAVGRIPDHGKHTRQDAKQRSGHAVEQLLRLALQLQPGILVRLAARQRGDALYEVEHALCRATNYAERRE